LWGQRTWDPGGKGEKRKSRQKVLKLGERTQIDQKKTPTLEGKRRDAGEESDHVHKAVEEKAPVTKIAEQKKEGKEFLFNTSRRKEGGRVQVIL